MDNFTVYAPFPNLPSTATMSAFAPDAQVEARGEQIVVRWPKVQITLTPLPREQLGKHMQGLLGWLKQNGGSPALMTRVMHTMGVFGCEIDPGFDETSFEFCMGLMQGSTGFAFYRNTLTDGVRDLVKEGLLRPSAARVARRAEILLCCAARALLEDDAGKPEQADAQVLCDEIGEWLAEDEGRLEEIEDDEQAFLDTKMGELDPEARIERVWGAESACAMLWALGVYELPPFTVTEHPYKLCKLAGIRGERNPKMTFPTLRKPDEIEALRNRYTAIHWRLIEKAMRPENAVDFVAFARKGSWLAPFDPVGLVPLVENDLVVEDVTTARSITAERHRALNWLAGVHPTYASVGTPT